jgi:hypothetical protein
MINVTKEQSDTHKYPQRRNLERNLWEIHGEDTRHGEPECTRCTQEISSHQKLITWEDTETNKRTQRGL